MFLRLILILNSFFIFSAYASDANVSGTIHDLETNLPLANTNIEVLNTLMGTVSDEQGNFDISLEPGHYELRFSMMGYQTQDIKINVEKAGTGNNTEKLNIVLIPTIYLMQGVVVIQERITESAPSEYFQVRMALGQWKLV